MLIAYIGYKGNQKPIFIFAGNGKLVAKFFKDCMLIREAKQQGFTEIKNYKKMEKFTKNDKTELEEKFIELKLTGKEIPTEKPITAIKEQGETPFFMEAEV